jgi:hypothetical protein
MIDGRYIHFDIGQRLKVIRKISMDTLVSDHQDEARLGCERFEKTNNPGD